MTAGQSFLFIYLFIYPLFIGNNTKIYLQEYKDLLTEQHKYLQYLHVLDLPVSHQNPA